MVEETKTLVKELPIQGDRRLLQLWRLIPQTRQGRNGSELSPLDQLRFLLVRLAENWARYRVFDWQPDVPWTNNPTEQVIGKMKMRARTVRGYKTWSGMASGLMLAGVGVAYVQHRCMGKCACNPIPQIHLPTLGQTHLDKFIVQANTLFYNGNRIVRMECYQDARLL